jgi:hypothetical protein
MRVLPSDVLIFGFGALLHPSKLPSPEPPWLACRAPKHTVAFCHRNGYASLKPLEDVSDVPLAHTSPTCAHGALYALTQQQVDVLVKKERGYDLQPIQVETLCPDQSGECYDALAFVSSPWYRLDRPVATTRRYADLLVSGAEIRGLPADYVEWLRWERDNAIANEDAAPAQYIDTFGRRTSLALSVGAGIGLVGIPVGRRLWQCREGWSPGTACETFFVPPSSQK